ncbi:MAG: DUF262 domain-containing protein, partial [Actinomycetaceae bacterium]|nr:DUF262 domain-containing protein [Actinomycetaceae bacterium]
MDAQYKSEQLTWEELKNKVSIPKYQRGLVWSKTMKEDFIENLHQGFPFGSILLYKYDEDEKYSLIDGLQRYSTIKYYEEHPNEFFSEIPRYTKRIKELLSQQKSFTPKEEGQLKKQIQKALESFLEKKASDEKYVF